MDNRNELKVRRNFSRALGQLDRDPSIGVVGLGAIGASIGLGGCSCGMKVVGLDPNLDHLNLATSIGAVDIPVTTLDALVGLPLVAVAVPPASTVDVVNAVLAVVDDRTTVMDVASTKQLLEEVEDARFVSTHPMRGSEVAGPEGARADLFIEATWVVCPSQNTSPRSLSVARELIRLLGAQTVFLSAERHDGLVARSSHLAHVIAAVNAHIVAAYEDGAGFSVCGAGLRDVTRIARGNPLLWTEIFSANRGPVTDAIGEALALLLMLRDALGADEIEIVTQFLADAYDALEQHLPPTPPPPPTIGIGT